MAAHEKAAPLPESPSKKAVANRLGNKAAVAAVTTHKPAPSKPDAVDAQGREFSGVVYVLKERNGWIQVDGTPEEQVYLLFADLPDDAAVVVGTRVSFDIVPGAKKGETKAGNILVHGGALGVVFKEGNKAAKGKGKAGRGGKGEATAAKGRGAGKGGKNDKQKETATQAEKRKQVVLSLDPEEEARRKKRAARFGVEHVPIDKVS